MREDDGLLPGGAAPPRTVHGVGEGPLAGRRAVVAGTGTALELAVAHRLRQDGARVAAETHAGLSVQASARSGTDRSAASSDRARDELGGVDLVVVVVPAERGGPFAGSEVSGWTAVVDRRLNDPIAVARTYLEDLVTAAGEDRADLVLVGSAAAHELVRAFAVPTATAVAVAQLARALRTELAEDGVRVHHVAPGPLAAPGGGDGGLSVHDVASVVSFLAGLPAGTNLAEVSLLPTRPA